jgi:hypothetical protein
MPEHDPLLKELLRTFFLGFLALVAPQLRPFTWQFLDKELAFTGRRRGKREVDLVARLLLDGGEALLVHVEIEAQFRATIRSSASVALPPRSGSRGPSRSPGPSPP